METDTTDELKQAVTAMETVEELRKVASSLNIKFSGNTGEGTLRTKIMNYLDSKDEEEIDEPEDTPSFLGNDEPLPEVIEQPKVKGPPTIPELLLMDVHDIDPKDQTLIRQVVRAKALRLRRVKITNVDPADQQLSGGIITVMNKYTGKVSKYIPYGDESEGGYHIPEILLHHLKAQKFALRKEIKGGQFGVKKYKTTMVNKFHIEELPDLTPEELEELAAHQRASHSIDG